MFYAAKYTQPSHIHTNHFFKNEQDLSVKQFEEKSRVVLRLAGFQPLLYKLLTHNYERAKGGGGGVTDRVERERESVCVCVFVCVCVCVCVCVLASVETAFSSNRHTRNIVIS